LPCIVTAVTGRGERMEKDEYGVESQIVEWAPQKNPYSKREPSNPIRDATITNKL